MTSVKMATLAAAVHNYRFLKISTEEIQSIFEVAKYLSDEELQSLYEELVSMSKAIYIYFLLQALDINQEELSVRLNKSPNRVSSLKNKALRFINHTSKHRS